MIANKPNYKINYILIVQILFLLSSCTPYKSIITKKNGQKLEEYQVKRSDKKTKHGVYIKYYENKSTKSKANYIQEKGFFKDGLKDSLWTEYYPPKIGNGSVNCCDKKEEGNYKAGKKVGVWLSYTDEIVLRYDYDSLMDLEPIIQVSISYPDIARENKIQGAVIVSFEVGSNCTLKQVKIIKSLSPECDAEVIRVIKRMIELQKQHGIKCEAGMHTKEINFKLLQ